MRRGLRKGLLEEVHAKYAKNAEDAKGRKGLLFVIL